METKNIINIPEGYKIDKEKSTDRQIVLKALTPKRPKNWEEYCEMKDGKPSFYFDDFKICEERYGDGFVGSTEFDTKDEVKAYIAFGRLIRLRKAWVKDWKPDWTNIYQPKYAIANSSNKLVDCTCREISHPLSFPTEEMRDEFFNCFKDLLEQAKTLL